MNIHSGHPKPKKKLSTMPINYPYYIRTLSYGLHLCYLFCSKWNLQTRETKEWSFSKKKSWNYVRRRIEGLRSRTQPCRSGTAISGNRIFSLRAFRVSLFRSIHMFLKSTESPRRKPRNIEKKKEEKKNQVYLWLTNPALHLQNKPDCKRRTEVGRRSS